MERILGLSKCPSRRIPFLYRSLATAATSAPSSPSFPPIPPIIPPATPTSTSSTLTSTTPHPLPSGPPPFVHVPLRTYDHTRPLAAGFPLAHERVLPGRQKKRFYVPLFSSVFNVPRRKDLLHRVMTWERARIRQGTAATKNRAMVNYSGRKIRPQKKTGRSRLGSRGSPMLHKGGVAFGPGQSGQGPKEWGGELPRKVVDSAIRIALSDKWRNGRVIVVDWWGDPKGKGEEGTEMKTKTGLARLRRNLVGQNALVVVGEGYEFDKAPKEVQPYEKQGRKKGKPSRLPSLLAVERSLRNLEQVDVVKWNELSVYGIMLRKWVVMDLEALGWIQGRLASS
ncbi:ribosomal protein L4 [Atractiella rhizophila]|nr:ribosomal protein L4 [Atractiella rhizophila]